ncbi:MAG: hypothetical protein KIT31_40190 [Deltaproteobacteria bacterium]|nr:hypothetical protein [Deltaproteobacteria bacterium]
MTSRRVAIHSQLADLAALEVSLRVAVRALYVACPELAPGLRDEHRIELTTAAAVTDNAEDLLVALDHHRSSVLYNLAAVGELDHRQTAWPF